MPAWILWLCLAALLVLPVVAAFAENRPPSNEITDEQDPDGPSPDRDEDGAAMRAAALGSRA